MDGVDEQEADPSSIKTSRRPNNLQSSKNADLSSVYRSKTGGDTQLREKIKQHFDVLGLTKVERVKFEKLLTLTTKKR